MCEKKRELFEEQTQFVAFDTETTGLWAPSHRLVEIAGIKFQLGRDQVENFEALIHPGRKIPKEVIRVHGITDEMVDGAKPAGQVLPDFLRFCGKGSVLIAHNALFDISFLACELDRNELAYPNNHILDTVAICRKAFPGIDSYSLLSLAQHFGLAQKQEHRALDDARLVQQLFVRACEKNSNIDSLDKLITDFHSYSISDWQPTDIVLPDEFTEIGKAMEKNLQVEITYSANNQPPLTRVIKPIAVYTLKSKVYINAYCELAGEERTFRLDRIESYRLLG